MLPSTALLTFASNVPASASYAYEVIVLLSILPVVAVTLLTLLPAVKLVPGVLSVNLPLSMEMILLYH